MSDPYKSFNFRALTSIGVNEVWTMMLENIPQDAQSVIVELYGSNGGIFRFFPRGRQSLTVQLKFHAAGTAYVYASIRDKSLYVRHLTTMSVAVQHPSMMAGAGGAPMTPMASSPAGHGVEALGVQKPPMAIDVLQQTVGNAPQPVRGGSLSGDMQAFAGEIANITAYASDSIKKVAFSAQNASMGWMMPVDISSGSASASATMGQPGTATIFAKFIDETGAVAHEASHAIQVVARNVEGPGRPTIPSPGDALRARADSLMSNLSSKLGKK